MTLDTTLDFVIGWLEITGIAVFAISGALEASRRQMDAVGFILIAAMTGIGGGTVRDLLLGATPVAWVMSPHIIVIIAVSAVTVFFTAHKFESRFKILLWADAVGLALFCVLGAEKALNAGVSGLSAVLLGVITATFGGIARDVICNEVPLILRREIYATAAATGASAFVLLSMTEIPHALAVIGAFFCGFTVRALAIIYGFSLPGYRSKPGRSRLEEN